MARQGEQRKAMPHKTCEFAVRYHEDSFMKEFYFNAEKEDGYIATGAYLTMK